jgi:hypothetical protein
MGFYFKNNQDQVLFYAHRFHENLTTVIVAFRSAWPVTAKRTRGFEHNLDLLRDATETTCANASCFRLYPIPRIFDNFHGAPFRSQRLFR